MYRKRSPEEHAQQEGPEFVTESPVHRIRKESDEALSAFNDQLCMKTIVNVKNPEPDRLEALRELKMRGWTQSQLTERLDRVPPGLLYSNGKASISEQALNAAKQWVQKEWDADDRGS